MNMSRDGSTPDHLTDMHIGLTTKAQEETESTTVHQNLQPRERTTEETEIEGEADHVLTKGTTSLIRNQEGDMNIKTI